MSQFIQVGYRSLRELIAKFLRPWKRIRELETWVKKLEKQSARRLQDCINLEKQKSALYKLNHELEEDRKNLAAELKRVNCDPFSRF